MFKVVLLCGLGAVLVRRNVIGKTFLRDLSRLIILVFLPCLLVTKIGRNVTVEQLAAWWVVPVASVTYVLIGGCLGCGLRRFFCRDEALRKYFVACCAVGNSGYLPLMFVTALCTLSPVLSKMDNSSGLAVAAISLSLVGVAPALWGWAFPYVSNQPFSLGSLRKIFNPPVVSVFAGLLIGLTPLKGLFWGDGAQLQIVASVADMLGAVTVPSAMLVLGGNLSRGPLRGAVHVRTVAGVALVKLLLLPGLILALYWGLDSMGLISLGPVPVLVMLVTASSPSAMNFIVMSQSNQKGESGVASLLFWIYLLSLVTLTASTMVYLHVAVQ